MSWAQRRARAVFRVFVYGVGPPCPLEGSVLSPPPSRDSGGLIDFSVEAQRYLACLTVRWRALRVTKVFCVRAIGGPQADSEVRGPQDGDRGPSTERSVTTGHGTDSGRHVMLVRCFISESLHTAHTARQDMSLQPTHVTTWANVGRIGGTVPPGALLARGALVY